MRWKKVLLSVFACLLGGFAGAIIGAQFGYSAAQGQMLASGAIFLFYMLIGFGLAVLVTGYLCWRTTLSGIAKLTAGLVVVAVALGLFFRHQVETRKAEREARQSSIGAVEVPEIAAGDALVIKDHNEEIAPDTAISEIVQEVSNYQSSAGEELKGFGFVRVPFGRDGFILRFFAGPELDAAITDSLTYIREDNRNVLQYAPPYLLPYYLKEDYESLMFRISGVHGNRVEIDLNEDTGRRAWVNRRAVEVAFWPDFLTTVAMVYPLDPTTNPVRRKALPHAPTADFPDGSFYFPDYIRGDWVRVFPMLPNGDQPRIPAWIRWREDGRLLVGWDYRM